MQPTPSERLKKDWPRAAAMAGPSSLPKSGRTRYSTPFSAPGRLRDTPAMITTMTNSTGMEILEKRPIPLSTPATTIIAVSPRNTSIQLTLSTGDEPTLAKTSLASDIPRPSKEAPSERIR